MSKIFCIFLFNAVLWCRIFFFYSSQSFLYYFNAVNYAIANALIIVIIKCETSLTVTLMIKTLKWVGFRALRWCSVCWGLSNWSIRYCVDPQTSTPSTSVLTWGGWVCLSQAYYSKMDQASCMQLWPRSLVAVWNVWRRPPPQNKVRIHPEEVISDAWS